MLRRPVDPDAALRRTDEPVAEIVPNSQPINPFTTNNLQTPTRITGNVPEATLFGASDRAG